MVKRTDFPKEEGDGFPSRKLVKKIAGQEYHRFSTFVFFFFPGFLSGMKTMNFLQKFETVNSW